MELIWTNRYDSLSHTYVCTWEKMEKKKVWKHVQSSPYRWKFYNYFIDKSAHKIALKEKICTNLFNFVYSPSAEKIFRPSGVISGWLNAHGLGPKPIYCWRSCIASSDSSSLIVRNKAIYIPLTLCLSWYLEVCYVFFFYFHFLWLVCQEACRGWLT